MWEDLYARATPEQRQQLLQRAGQDGILHAQHLAGLASSSAQPVLTALLKGAVPDLAPVPVLPFTPFDAELDPTQREAVARALASSDLCLIQGSPGTGKSRVAAEIIRQTISAGQRALLLAPSPPGLDRVLEQLAGSPFVCSLRCLEADEEPETLPADMRALTLAGREQHFKQQTLGQARQALASAQKQWDQMQQEGTAWEQLAKQVEQAEKLVAQVRMLEQEQAGLPAIVEVESAAPAASVPTPFQTRLREKETLQTQQLAEFEKRASDPPGRDRQGPG